MVAEILAARSKAGYIPERDLFVPTPGETAETNAPVAMMAGAETTSAD